MRSHFEDLCTSSQFKSCLFLVRLMTRDEHSRGFSRLMATIVTLRFITVTSVLFRLRVIRYCTQRLPVRTHRIPLTNFAVMLFGHAVVRQLSPDP